MRAMNDTVGGTASNEVAVTPGVPTAPRDLTADSGTPEEITLSWTAPAYTGTPTLTKYEYRYTSVAPDGVPQWPTSSQTGFWAPTSDTTPPGTATELILSAAGDDKILEPGTVYYFQVRAVNEIGGDERFSLESNTDDGIATAVAAGWTFKIETLDGNNVVTSLVAGETALTLRFTATYTVDTADRSGLNSLWATFEDGYMTSAILPASAADKVGFGSGVGVTPEVAATLSASSPPPICTADTDAGTLTCVKPFAEKLYATADADLGEYELINTVGSEFTVTAMVNGSPAHSATPTAANIADQPDRNPQVGHGNLVAGGRDGDGVRPR